MVFSDPAFTPWVLDFFAVIYYLLNELKEKELSDQSVDKSALRDQCSDTSHRGICVQGNSKWMLISQDSWILNCFVNDEINQVLQEVIWGPEFMSWLWKYRESLCGATWTPGSSTRQIDGQTLEDSLSDLLCLQDESIL